MNLIEKKKEHISNLSGTIPALDFVFYHSEPSSSIHHCINHRHSNNDTNALPMSQDGWKWWKFSLIIYYRLGFFLSAHLKLLGMKDSDKSKYITKLYLIDYRNYILS